MKATLEQELSKLRQGDHICTIYENTAEQMAGAVPFLKEGLARGERGLYVADDHIVKTLVQALAAAGVAVAQERERDAFWTPTKQDSYLKGGKFDPQTMIDFLRSAQSQALADGFSGLRVVGEMTWALGPEVGNDRLIEFEALLNDFMANSRSIILCQYNRSRFDPAIIHDVLRTHPTAIIGDLVCPNPYYEPPELVLSPDEQASAEFKRRRVAWWIAQLKRARFADQERESAQEAVRESHQLLRVVLDTLPVGVAVTDRAGNIVLANAACKRIWGDMIVSGGERWARSKGYWHDSGKMIEPEKWASARALSEGQTSLNELIDIETFDGQQKTIQNSAAPIRNAEGLILGVVVVNEDVTERVRAEETVRESADRLQHLSRQLLEVQEEERRHLARELHDEFGQLLAAITLHLHVARGLAGDSARLQLDQCATLLQQAGEQVRSLALELRPTMLDTLGLEATLRWLAEQHQQRTGREVQVVGHLTGPPLSPDLSIACFRVVQEALTNVVRHAAARHVWIELSQSENVLELVVRDDGVGFDVAAAQEKAARRGRLGLLGMAERVQILGGTLHVESQPGRGARIRAAFPLNAGSEERIDPEE
jgi:signal transduction histidine kinase